jgi:hypothetical protein
MKIVTGMLYWRVELPVIKPAICPLCKHKCHGIGRLTPSSYHLNCPRGVVVKRWTCVLSLSRVVVRALRTLRTRARMAIALSHLIFAFTAPLCQFAYRPVAIATEMGNELRVAAGAFDLPGIFRARSGFV